MNDRKKLPYDAFGNYAPVADKCTDDEYIKRGDALKVFCEYCGVCEEEKRKPLECDDILGNVLKRLPAADVRPVVRGKWDGTADGYADGKLVYDMWECSCCGFDADGAEEKPTWNYCPNCGAVMREV